MGIGVIVELRKTHVDIHLAGSWLYAVSSACWVE
jgi:hypothetical protein